MQIQIFYSFIVANPLVISLQSAQTRIETSDDRANQASFIALLEALSFTIDRIACQVITKNYCKNSFLRMAYRKLISRMHYTHGMTTFYLFVYIDMWSINYVFR